MQTYFENQLENQQDLPALLDTAARDGGLRIQRRDGQTFVLVPENTPTSPLNVAGIDLNISTAEIVATIRESRERSAQ